MKLEWLVECIGRKVAVDCDPYIYHLIGTKAKAMADEQATAPSPASKRNILLMSQTSKQATPKRLNFGDANSSLNGSKNVSPNDRSMNAQTDKERAEDEIIDQYLQAQKPPTVQEPVAGPSKITDGFKVPAQPPAQTTQASVGSENTESDSEFDYTASSGAYNQIMFLANLKVHIRGFDKESHESLVEDCRIAGAEVIEDNNYKGTVDYLILPVDAITMDGITVKAKKMVNHNWLVSEAIYSN